MIKNCSPWKKCAAIFPMTLTNSVPRTRSSCASNWPTTLTSWVMRHFSRTRTSRRLSSWSRRSTVWLYKRFSSRTKRRQIQRRPTRNRILVSITAWKSESKNLWIPLAECFSTQRSARDSLRRLAAPWPPTQWATALSQWLRIAAHLLWIRILRKSKFSRLYRSMNFLLKSPSLMLSAYIWCDCLTIIGHLLRLFPFCSLERVETWRVRSSPSAKSTSFPRQ